MVPSQSSTTNVFYPPYLTASIETHLSETQRGAVDGIKRFLFPSIQLHLNICNDASSPALGPALTPPSRASVREIAKRQKLRALAIPLPLAERLLQESDGLNLFRDLDFLCCKGGPIRQKAGETLVNATELCPFHGSTKSLQVPQLRPKGPQKGSSYIKWSPHQKHETQPTNGEVDTFEVVLLADASTEKIFPNVREWRTKDLYKRHPRPARPSLWPYYGRRDDFIVFSDGNSTLDL